MARFKYYLLILILIFIPLYPKFPLVGVSGSFVAVRLDDFVVAFVVGIWFLFAAYDRFRTVRLPVQRAILLYLFIGFVSLFSGIFLTKSATLQLGFLHAFRRVEYMSLFFVAYDFLTRKDQIPSLIRIILAVSLVVALYGLGQQFLGFPIISTTNSEFAKGLALSLGPGARINSSFAGHYDLAAYSLFPLLIILGLLMSPVRRKLLLILLAVPVYITLLLTGARLTFAAFFAMSFVFVWIMRRRLLIIPLFLLAVISLLLTPSLLGRYQQLLIGHFLSFTPVVYAQTPPADQQIPDALKPAAVPEDRSTSIRFNAEWPMAIRAFLKNPVLGTGFSSVGLATDSDYLRLLAETGILGFAAFLLVILRLIKMGWPYLSHPPSDLYKIFILACILGLVGLLINSVFIDIFEASKIAIITWTIMGLVYKVEKIHD